MFDNPSLIVRMNWLRQYVLDKNVQLEENTSSHIYDDQLQLQNKLLKSLLIGPYNERKWCNKVKNYISLIIKKHHSNVTVAFDTFKATIVDTKIYWKYHDTRIVAADLVVHLLMLACECLNNDDDAKSISSNVTVHGYIQLLGEIMDFYFNDDKHSKVSLCISHNSDVIASSTLSTGGTSNVEAHIYVSVLKCIYNQNCDLFRIMVTQWLEKEYLLQLSLLSTTVATYSSKNTVSGNRCWDIMGKDKQLNELLNEKVIDLYVKNVLTSKTTTSKQCDIFKLLQPYFSTLNVEFWNHSSSTSELSLEGHLLQALKKAPEGSARYISSLVSQLPIIEFNISSNESNFNNIIHLDNFIMEGGAMSALRMLKSTTSSMRYYGIVMFYHMSCRCLDIHSYIFLIRTLLNAIEGKGGFVSIVNCRALIYLTLCYLSTNIPTLIRYSKFNIQKSVTIDEKNSVEQQLQNVFHSEILPVLISYLEGKEVDEMVQVFVVKCILSYIQTWIQISITYTTENENNNGNNSLSQTTGYELPQQLLDSAKSSILKNKPSTSLHFLHILVSIARHLKSHVHMNNLKENKKSHSTVDMKITNINALQLINQFLIEVGEPLITHLVNMTKESVKKPLAVQPAAVLAYELLLHFGYFAACIININNEMKNTVSNDKSIDTSTNIVSIIISAKLWKSAATSSTAPLHSINFLQSILLNGFKKTINNQEISNCYDMSAMSVNDITYNEKNSEVINKNISPDLRRIKVFTDIHAIVGKDIMFDDHLEKEILSVNGVCSCTESLSYSILSILNLSAILQPSDCFNSLHEFSAEVMIKSNSDSQSSFNDISNINKDSLSTADANMISSIIFVLSHPSLDIRKNSSKQLQELYISLRSPLSCFQSIFTSVSTNVKSTSVSPFKITNEMCFGESVARNICLQLLIIFYDSLLTLSTTNLNSKDSANASVNDAEKEIVDVTHQLTATNQRQSLNETQISPSVLLSVLMSCVTSLLPHFSILNDSINAENCDDYLIIKKLQSLNLNQNINNSNSNDENTVDLNEESSRIHSSYIAKCITYVLLILGHPYLSLNPGNDSIVSNFDRRNKNISDETKQSNRVINTSSSKMKYILNFISTVFLGGIPQTTSFFTRNDKINSINCHLSDVLLCLNSSCRDYFCQFISATLYYSKSLLIRQSAQNVIIILVQHAYYCSFQSNIENSTVSSIGHVYLLNHILPIILLKLQLSEYKNLSSDDLFKFLNPSKAIQDYSSKAEIKDDDIKITNADRMKDSSRASRRGNFGNDRLEDKEWEERLKKEKKEKLLLERTGGVSMADIEKKAAIEVKAGADRIKNTLFLGNCSLICLGSLFKKYKMLQINSNRYQNCYDDDKKESNNSFVMKMNKLLDRFFTTLLSKTLEPIVIHISDEYYFSSNRVESMSQSQISNEFLSTNAYECLRVMSQSLIESSLGNDVANDLAASIRLVSLEYLIRNDSKNNDNHNMNASSYVYSPTGPIMRLLKTLLSSASFTKYRQQKSQLRHENEKGLNSSQPLIDYSFISDMSAQLIFIVLKRVLTLQKNNLPVGFESAFLILDCLWPIKSVQEHQLSNDNNSNLNIDDDGYINNTCYQNLRKILLKPMVELILSVAEYHPRLDPPPETILTRILIQENFLCRTTTGKMETNSFLILSEWFPMFGDKGYLSGQSFVRLMCARSVYSFITTVSLQTLNNFIQTITSTPLFESRLFASQYDTDTETSVIGKQIWDFIMSQSEKGSILFHLSEDYYSPLATLFSHENPSIREMAAKALAGAISVYPQSSQNTIEKMKSLLLFNQPPMINEKHNIAIEKSFVKETLPSATTALLSLHKSATLAKQEIKKKATTSINLSGIGNISSIGVVNKPVVKKVSNTIGSGLSLSNNLVINKAKSNTTPAVVTKQSTSISSESESYVTLDNSNSNTTTSNNTPEQLHMKENIRLTIATFFINIGVQKVAYLLPSADSPQREIGDNEINIVISLIEFILNKGCTDNSDKVREQMVLAGRAIIDNYCVLSDSHSTAILAIIRKILSEKQGTSNCTLSDTAFDCRHEAGVVFLGSVGKHLNKDDIQIFEIIQSLSETLSTPSESVQKAVADCLTPLVNLIKGKEEAGVLLESLLNKSIRGATYADRRGNAYGLSACIKGMGIPSLKQYDVVNQLKNACSDGAVNERQGALIALECLSDRLGLLFEPYVIIVIPILLKSFSHPSDHVREAAQDAAKVIMSKLSAHGVKQMLTPVLNSIPDEVQWKSRQEAIRLLGMMANCAPKQLATCLPQIIPKLVEAGSDPHPKVKESAKLALSEIASVIRSPELKTLSPVLLLALSDPANKTKDALEGLLECEFLHSIDTASLALLIPILGRSLKDRLAEIKRKGCAIISNIISMVIDVKQVAPYLSGLIPGLKDCLIDPIPDVRAASAKAVGSLMHSLGDITGANSTDAGYEDIREMNQWMVSTLGSETSPVERSGAAQGLAEICRSLGVSKLTAILQETLPYKNSTMSSRREGLLWLLSFLPTAMRDSFGSFISTTLPVILSGLSDENESVRDVAMRAGQVLVSTLGQSYSFDILPSLRQGMFAEDSRIRLSSITLLGDLLYLISDTKAVGMSSNAEGGDDDEDIIGADAIGSSNKALQAIRNSLGTHLANSVLASLYIVRSDVSNSVRHLSLQVWKSVITNTPRTLLEVVEELVHQVLEKLSSESEQLRLVAGKALGEVVRKMGDRVLPLVMPLLQNDLTHPEVTCRQGVCLGLSEILHAVTTKQVEDYLSLFIHALQIALSDENDVVRNHGAKVFQVLHKMIGIQSIEAIVPPLLNKIVMSNEVIEATTSGSDITDRSFLALKELVQARPRDLLEYLLPKLMSSGSNNSKSSTNVGGLMTISSAKILGAIASVCNHQLMYHFQYLVSMFAVELNDADVALTNLEIEFRNISIDSPDHETLQFEVKGRIDKMQVRFDAIKSSIINILTVVNSSGIAYLLPELGSQIDHESCLFRRRWGCWMLQQFLTFNKTAKYTDYVPLLLRYILNRIVEFDMSIIPVIIDTFTALVTAVQLDVLMEQIEFIKNCMSSVISDIKHRTGQNIQYIKVHSVINSYSNDSSIGSGSKFKEYIVLPLFTQPRSIEPFLTIFLHGLLNGSIKIRELSAECITDIISYVTDSNILKPYFIKTTGPLIRVLGDRFPSEVKSSILVALTVLLEKGGVALKPFAPQLQTTFVKSLNDSSKNVRIRAVQALGLVVTLSTRIDPLLNELCSLYHSTGTANVNINNGGSNGIDSSNNQEIAQAAAIQASYTIKASVLSGIYITLKVSGEKSIPASLVKVKNLLFSSVIEASSCQVEEETRMNIAKCFASLTCYVEEEITKDTITELLQISTKLLTGNSCVAAGRIMALAGIVHSCAFMGILPELRDKALQVIKSGFTDDRVSVRIAACQAIVILTTLTPIGSSVSTLITIANNVTKEAEEVETIQKQQERQKLFAISVIHLFADPISSAAGDINSGEVRKAAIIVIKEISKRYPGATNRHIQKFIPPLVAVVKDIDIRAKYIADRALYNLFYGSGIGSESSSNVKSEAWSQFESVCQDKELVKFTSGYINNTLNKMNIGNEMDSDQD